ncbi:hypothetical protein VTL71DRAFT_9681 [Oculimacula yallundae]|uniref:AIG1-type G domain-containing protein n=1 Tax=Oculimacula yallundae TaxID=86028 RepID=A0ABR4BT60_9HELO
MVLLMGTTGAGKSFFINKLKEGATVIGDDLYSCTATCQLVLTRIGRTNVAVIDCPGFNDTYRSDTDILEEIAKVLSTQYLYQRRLKLRGILWLRDITRTKMEGSDVRTLRLFSQLVGKAAFRHIVFVSTKWGTPDNHVQKLANEKRETQLKEDFWQAMIYGGSNAQRFLGTRASAEGIVSQLVGAVEPVAIQIQVELMDQELPLSATAAGMVLAPDVDSALKDWESRIRDIKARLKVAANGVEYGRLLQDMKNAEHEQEAAKLEKEKLLEKVGSKVKQSKVKKASTWQTSVRTMSSVLGLSVSIVGAVLPAVGVCTLM